MTKRDWDGHYATGELPWDTGVPEGHLVVAVDGGTIRPGRALEVGCGTGTNALWLATKGFDVVALDVSPLAIERANAKKAAAGEPGERCRFLVADFLAEDVPGGPFEFVFDRGVFHTLDEAGEREQFVARVAAHLGDGGQWLSLIGSTEGGPRDTGPPRRTAREVMSAIEPVLEVVEFRATQFEALPDQPVAPMVWLCRSRVRRVPAVPSSRHE
jgi:methyl halide transferase